MDHVGKNDEGESRRSLGDDVLREGLPELHTARVATKQPTDVRRDVDRQDPRFRKRANETFRDRTLSASDLEDAGPIGPSRDLLDEGVQIDEHAPPRLADRVLV